MGAVLCLLWALIGRSLHAQAPFSSVSIGAIAAQEIGQGRFDAMWETSPSGGLSIRMPFHVGELEAGFSVARNRSLSAARPDFTSAIIHAGWGPTLRISTRLRARALLHAGDFLMVFDEGGAGYSRRENELLLGASGGVSLLISEPIAVFGRAAFYRIYTSTPIEFIQIAAGVEIRLPTSERLRSLLR